MFNTLNHKGNANENCTKTGCQWLMPVILSTQKAEIWRIQFKTSLRHMVHKILFQKYPIQKKAGGVAQVVEHLPSKCEFRPQDHRGKKHLNLIIMAAIKKTNSKCR
jgi:hypothetical protein